MSKLVRIPDESFEELNKLEQQTGSSKQELLKQAVDRLSREIFLHQLNKDYEALRNDPQAWKEELEERAEIARLDSSLEDL